MSAPLDAASAALPLIVAAQAPSKKWGEWDLDKSFKYGNPSLFKNLKQNWPISYSLLNAPRRAGILWPLRAALIRLLVGKRSILANVTVSYDSNITIKTRENILLNYLPE